MPALTPNNLPAHKGSDYKGPAAVYVHWPFCLKKCPYCDFNSHVRDHVSHETWRNALVQEIETMATKFPNLSAKSIFFGGGTPSLMEPETVYAVIETIQKHWAPNREIEITLEANPSSVEASRFQAYKQAGVNRLSVGIQSLRDDALKFLGRLHNAGEALKALEVARNNFNRVSFDLIYARPQQSPTDWETELKEALAFDPTHLSLYQLTIEEGTAFYHQFHRGKFTLPDEDEAAELYDLTQQLTEAKGLPAYETSNHAAAGEESQHNLCYWQGDYYVGIGPGAHGRLPAQDHGSAYAHAQIKRPEDWMRAVEANGTGLETLEYVDAEDRAVEALMMGLRLRDGVDIATWEQRFGYSTNQIINNTELSNMKTDGFITDRTDKLQLSVKGRPLLNYILQKLVI
ncbi:coproporphyrinogen III oxidase [Kordiimonas sp. SCSIO 12603]|uniref:radical SAM family heme chaperone HemW n=1 Tax=Kordiimonas sp. SCSIO 12603 TaxID=2829596 RepID=UPI00210663CE|nr:radical SAM family heme chaperone HemW [Kordiimonas sp. SCSIO 12603]UTW59115.1 coproporphyrinogen III oxidase [Kordiimonas sp. SCSIO 12603]